jgi:hypothetical protein
LRVRRRSGNVWFFCVSFCSPDEHFLKKGDRNKERRGWASWQIREQEITLYYTKKAKQCGLSKTDCQLWNEKCGRQKFVSTIFFSLFSKIWGEKAFKFLWVEQWLFTYLLPQDGSVITCYSSSSR